MLLLSLAARHLVLTGNLVLRRGLLGLAAAEAVLHFSSPDWMTDTFLLLLQTGGVSECEVLCCLALFVTFFSLPFPFRHPNLDNCVVAGPFSRT